MAAYRKHRRLFWWRGEREIQAEVDEELKFHFDARVNELRASGWTATAARTQAEAEFGDVQDARRYMIEVDRRQEMWQRRAEVLSSALHDVRIGWRGLRRDRGFLLVAVLTLALGIGANSAIYGLVDGVLLRQLPYAEADRLVAVTPEYAFMRAEYALARERMGSLEQLGGYQPGVGFSVTIEGEAVRLVGAHISSTLFKTLAVRPTGRDFRVEEEQVNRGRVAIISHGLWQRWFGGQTNVLGRSMVIDGLTHHIVGIAPFGFAFPDARTELWVPATIDAAERSTYWGIGGMRAVGRLRPGATALQARAELRALGEDMRLANPFWTPKAPYRADADVVPLHESLVGDSRRMLLVLLGAVAVVWLIACANVANLMLARGLARERELAVRMALGAARGRVVRQLVTESLTLSLLGGVAGLALGWLVLKALLPFLPSDLPRLNEVRLDVRVLVYTIAASVLAGVGFGVFPAFRVVTQQLTSSLKENLRTGTSARHRRLSSTVVVAEVALAVVLVTGAGLLLQSLQNLSRVDTGFTSSGVISARVSPPAALYREPERRAAFYDRVLSRLRTEPGVGAVAWTGQLPFDGELSLTATAVEFVSNDPNDLPVFEFRPVTPEYFQTLGIPLIEGRGFTEADRAGTLPVAIVDRATAERFWPGQTPVGKRMGRPWLREWRTVVGVVGSVRNNQLRGKFGPSYYVPLAQEPGNAAVLVIRSSTTLEAAAAQIRTVVREADPSVPVSDVRSVDELVWSASARERTAALLIGVFATLAVLLGAIGLYGVLSYAVTQRRQELSLRSALGASRTDLLGLVMRDGVLLGAIGLVIGLPAALLSARVLSTLLYGVEPGDLSNLLRVAAVLLVTCVLAALLPALRAVRAQPAEALRG
jgi:putative ABC transport system permease protein